MTLHRVVFPVVVAALAVAMPAARTPVVAMTLRAFFTVAFQSRYVTGAFWNKRSGEIDKNSPAVTRKKE